MPRKKGRQGSIYYDKSRKKYRAETYEINYKTDRYFKKTRSFDTREDAEKYLASQMYQRNNAIYIKNNGIPLCQLMRANLQRKFDSNRISENQFGRVGKTIEIIEKSTLSNKLIDDLTSESIQDYLNTLKDYSNSYIKKIFEQFTQSFNYALNKGYIVKNPMVDVIKPKSNKKDKEVRALTIEEQQAFTEYLLNNTLETVPYRTVYFIQMYMGPRISEVLALKSTDIDLKNNLINIERTLTTDENSKVIMGNTTKTYAGIRQLPIPQTILPYIIEQMEISKANNNNMLFLSPNGNYVDNRNVNRNLKKILLSEFKITDISTHSLRHTYATRCIESGMNPVSVQRLMGHTDVSITLNTYTSVFNKFKESELNKVNNYYLENNFFSNGKK